MRTLEVVRHSLTRKGAESGKASSLSPEGVRLARQLGDSLTSGDSIEPVLVAAFPDADLAARGGPLDRLEGATILVEGGCFTGVMLCRGPLLPSV